MDIPNAFIGSKDHPSPKELSSALGPSAAVWTQLVQALAARLGISEQEWSSSSPKHGWSLRLKAKKRAIVYLSPCVGCFRVSFALGTKAIAAAHKRGLAGHVIKLLDEAPHYPEGVGLRLIVKSARDLPDIERLAQIKLAN